MASPIYGAGFCGRCGKEYETSGRYEPSSLCMGCVIEREMNRAKSLPVREKLKASRKRK